jgi:hypothetical protein
VIYKRLIILNINIFGIKLASNIWRVLQPITIMFWLANNKWIYGASFMKKLALLRALFACLFLISVTPLHAATILDFSTGLAGPGGTITPSPSAVSPTSVSGSLINIGALTLDIDGTVTVYSDVDALLSFNTATDFILINGSIPSLGINSDIDLLSGSFDNWDFLPVSGNESFSGSGPDTKAPELLSALGIPSVEFEFFGFTIETQNGTVISTDIVNTAVPVPAAVWLFGSGLIGLVGIARRKNSV